MAVADPGRVLNEIRDLIRKGRLVQACQRCEATVQRAPEYDGPRLAWCQALKRLGRFAEMRDVIDPALEWSAESLPVLLCATEARLLTGRHGEAVSLLQKAEALANHDGDALQHIGEMYTHCIRYEEAARCYRRSLELSPDDTRYEYNLAASLISLGKIREAEALLDKVIASNPRDYDAWQNRSMLRKATATSNHIADLERLLASSPGPGAETPLCYALARELEDTGNHEAAFRYLQRGARRRRAGMSYDVRSDIDTLSEIRSVFTSSVVDRPATRAPGSQLPVFICGLPRSGTTLVDRIVSSHSQVSSLGEINDFAVTLVRLLGGQQDKRTLVRRSASLDPALLGAEYLESVRGYGQEQPCFIDKTPANFLYLGLVSLALPEARIIHVSRHPMDSCYAMYKTLFRMGYPFSYDLEDLAQYYIAYRQLMDHWREVLPGRFLDVKYEDLVRDPLSVSRDLIRWCGLSWEAACEQFHLNTSPAATASAAQVREPVYTTSLQRWRCYERQLAPLAARLESAGIDIT